MKTALACACAVALCAFALLALPREVSVLRAMDAALREPGGDDPLPAEVRERLEPHPGVCLYVADGVVAVRTAQGRLRDARLGTGAFSFFA
jgi:hypothetical protein